VPHLILAIDTTQQNGSIALQRDGVLLEEAPIAAATGFSSVIYGELERLLDRHKVALADIDRYAVAAGPGSFTGVRVGITVAKGLAEAHGKLVVPVSNLQALASLAEACGPVCAMIDVRRGEFAAAVYDESLEEMIAPFAATYDEVTRRAAEAGASLFDSPLPLAGAIARIAATRTGCDPAAADAEYVRRADITLPKP
jgi:tRNA threonylcarbamoyladenosine biosynthesis protein TsaB